jgi:uncharacterized membrane protein YfbV (UPF0208 family)
MNFEEALLSVALYAFSLSALALPIVISWFTKEFYKRLKRLDEALEIIEETERYGKSERSNNDS